jgi:hypothetical protein
MAAISGANPIVTSDINNFTGELFKITPHRTPLLAAAGGLNGGVVSNTTYFQFQTQDNETISSVTPETEGGQPSYNGRSRSAQQGVLQIFHEAVQVSFTAQAAYGEIVPFDLANNYKNSIDKLSLEGNNPVTDELAYQMELLLEKIAKMVEWSAFNASFDDGTGANPRQMRGLKEHLDLTGGTAVNNDDGGGTPAAQKLNWSIIADAMKALYDAGAPMRQPVLFVSPTMLLDLNKELVSATVGSVNYGILPRDRAVGGVDIDTIVTPFGQIGLALSDYLPAGTISGSKQAFIVDLSFVKPVFLNIPGYGTMFVRDIDQDDYARIAKAVYMEMAFDFGPQQYHCQIDNVVG